MEDLALYGHHPMSPEKNNLYEEFAKSKRHVAFGHDAIGELYSSDNTNHLALASESYASNSSDSIY